MSVGNLSSNVKLRAFIVGATGEVGKEIVKELAKNNGFENITIIGRRKLEFSQNESDSDYTKFNQQIVDFEKLSESSQAFDDHDVGFCTLGTTRGKAGKEGFYRVDHDYVVESAKLAKEAGCKHFNLLTAQGASKTSMIFYNKTKGEVEEDLKALGFERLSIYRPGLLIVHRQESRPLETCAQVLAKAFDFGHSGSISVPLLAKTMVRRCFTSLCPDSVGNVEILNNKTFYNLGQSL